jgi:uncharacterized protein (DUF58 family)
MMDSPEARALATPPFLFSQRGLAILALVTALAATFLATDITYLAGALLLVGLAAQGWSRVALWRVRYTRRTSVARAFAGEEVRLDSTLANPRPLPLPWIEVWELLPAQLKPDGVVERSFDDTDRVWVSRGLALWPYQRLRWRRRLVCQRRGVFSLGTIKLRTGDPFGLFERERADRDDLELLVYPRIVPLRQLAIPLRHPSLDLVSPHSPVADPTRTATVRDYRPDDARRLIHWPSSARRGSLQVRVLEPATSLHVSFLIDVRAFSFGAYEDELFESVLSAVASMAMYLHGAGAPVSLLANTDPPLVLQPGASVPHLQQVLEGLARLTSNAGPALLPWALGELAHGNTVVLATSDIAADVERSIGQLEDGGFHILPLMASAASTTALARTRAARRESILITPDCDVAARLEGRG